jgi:Xaa-Pro dipeptidase
MAKKKVPEPKLIRPDDINPHHNWTRPIHAPGHTQVDFEERINFRRLHDYRLARTRAALPVGLARCASTSTTSATPRAR